jgi:hypothetical protein
MRRGTRHEQCGIQAGRVLLLGPPCRLLADEALGAGERLAQQHHGAGHGSADHHEPVAHELREQALHQDSDQAMPYQRGQTHPHDQQPGAPLDAVQQVALGSREIMG